VVELELRELLDKAWISWDDTPIVRGSALLVGSASTDPNAPEYQCIWELMHAVTSTSVRDALREIDRPFLMPGGGCIQHQGARDGGDGRIERGRCG